MYCTTAVSGLFYPPYILLLLVLSEVCPHFLAKAESKAGISVCASQKEKTSLGPVMRSWGCPCQ
jgi:hypothetical protein